MSGRTVGRLGGLMVMALPMALLVALAASWCSVAVTLGAEPSASVGAEPSASVGAEPSASVGAEPSASVAAILEAGDPRSEGSGAGLVGSPFMILLGVVALGVMTALVTALLARLARRT